LQLASLPLPNVPLQNVPPLNAWPQSRLLPKRPLLLKLLPWRHPPGH
jgi:hypothetical protein